MEKVESLAQELEGSMEGVLNSLLDVESKLLDILKKHNLTSRGILERFEDEDISIQKFISNIGGYVALTFRGEQIPDTVSGLGQGFYIHNDFTLPACYVDAAEAMELADELPAYVEFFKETLQDLIVESKRVLENSTKSLRGIKEL